MDTDAQERGDPGALRADVAPLRPLAHPASGQASAFPSAVRARSRDRWDPTHYY